MMKCTILRKVRLCEMYHMVLTGEASNTLEKIRKPAAVMTRRRPCGALPRSKTGNRRRTGDSSSGCPEAEKIKTKQKIKVKLNLIKIDILNEHML